MAPATGVHDTRTFVPPVYSTFSFGAAGQIALMASCAIDGAASAQSAAPIVNRDVVGDWELLITPAEDQERRITFRARDGRRQLDFPLTISVQSDGRLACVISGDPAECRLRDGDLIIVSTNGGVRMTFTLTDRTREGFSGTAGLRVRLLPIGGPIGSVRMTRR